MSSLQLFTDGLLDDLLRQAGAAVRLRANHNVHASPHDPVQRLFIAAQRSSYFRPHRHDRAWEFVLVLRGHFDLIVFDGHGLVLERHAVGPGAGTAGFEVPANVWHAWVARTDGGVFLEVKPGTYDPQTAIDYAPWSPEEGSAAAAEFTEMLRGARAGTRVA